MEHILTKPLVLFKDSWALFRKNLWFMIKMHIGGQLFSLIVAVPGMLLFFFSLLSGNVFFSIIGGLLILPAIYVMLWWYVSFLRAVAHIDGGEVVTSVRKSFTKENRKKIFPFLGVSLLSSLIILGGIILLVIPGFIFAVWFALSGYVLVFEGVSIKESLKKSKNYIKGRFWKTFWRFVFVGLIYFLTYIPLVILIALIPEGTIKGIIQAFVEAAFGIVWSPLLMIYLYKLYKNLKETA